MDVSQVLPIFVQNRRLRGVIKQWGQSGRFRQFSSWTVDGAIVQGVKASLWVRDRGEGRVSSGPAARGWKTSV